MNKDANKAEKKQDSRELEKSVKCWEFLRPLVEQLHGLVDRLIVKTLLLEVAMVTLFHLVKWEGRLILNYLWKYGE